LVNDNVFVDAALALLRLNANLKAAELRNEIASRQSMLSARSVRCVATETVRHRSIIQAAEDAERVKTRQQAAINLAITIVNESGDEKVRHLGENTLAILIGGRDTTLWPGDALHTAKAGLQWRSSRIEELEERDHD
jgi:hypothetical protein